MNQVNSHPDTERLEALAAGELDRGEAAVVESHLVGCSRCREEVEEWRALFGVLADLPGIEPDVRFADAIMERVAVRSLWADRLAAALSWLRPRSTLAWALVAALFAMPALVYAGAFAWLASRPWFSIASTTAFLRHSLPEWLGGIGENLLGTIVYYEPIQAALATLASLDSGTLALAAAAFGTTVLVSVWVLYTNLIHTRERGSEYATFAF